MKFIVSLNSLQSKISALKRAAKIQSFFVLPQINKRFFLRHQSVVYLWLHISKKYVRIYLKVLYPQNFALRMNIY
jgi:hypothetical protein